MKLSPTTYGITSSAPSPPRIATSAWRSRFFNALVAQNTREGEVMDCLLRKLDDMRKALGSDRVYDVIGEIIPVPRFDALMKDWLSKRRTMAEILADIDLQTDETQVARIRADMNDRSLGSRHIDLSKLDADRQKSKEQRLMP